MINMPDSVIGNDNLCNNEGYDGQWRRHGEMGGSGPPPLLFRPLLGFLQIPLKSLFTNGGYPMHV